jgi:hypothetical protein
MSSESHKEKSYNAKMGTEISAATTITLKAAIAAITHETRMTRTDHK